MNKNFKYLTLAALAVGGIAVAPASAQNSAHTTSDLVLTIQNPGGTNASSTTAIAVLGKADLIFRDAAAGSFTLLSKPVGGGTGTINLNSTLSAFSDITNNIPWYEQNTLWIGAVEARSTTVSSTLFGTDPGGTFYATKARFGIGTVGLANSSFTPLSLGFAQNTLNNITAIQTQIEGGAATARPIQTYATGGSDQVALQNPVNSSNTQQAGYTNIAGGVQANFGLDSFGAGASFGAAGVVEIALDLYRVQYVNNAAGQYGFGAAADGSGEYLGTITINQAGDVGYTKAVPEPTSMAFLLLGGLGFAARRRRPATVIA